MGMRPLIADASLPPAPPSPQPSEAPPLAGGPAPPWPVEPTLARGAHPGPGPLPTVLSSTSHAHVPAASVPFAARVRLHPGLWPGRWPRSQRTWGLSVKPGAGGPSWAGKGHKLAQPLPWGWG